MGYSQNLCDLMQKSGISSYKLAQKIGVHTSTISNWRNGSTPKLEHLKLVADYFGVSVDDLLSDTEKYNSKPVR